MKRPIAHLSGIWRIVGLTLIPTIVFGNDYPKLNQEQIQWLGEQIFTNECNRQPACLTSWNAGENFPSLGIGHFIWYRADQEEIFAESFPQLLAWMQASGVAIPGWINESHLESPWQSRADFLADLNSERMTELREFLLNHQEEQTAFIIQRFSDALNAMTGSLAAPGSGNDTDVQAAMGILQDNFYRVANSSPPYGLYALVDYVNFKGTGVAAGEQYAGQGWGLKQVLLKMDVNQPPLVAFVQAARELLATRVENAPLERNEGRWLNGWNRRLETYLPATPKQTP